MLLKRKKHEEFENRLLRRSFCVFWADWEHKVRRAHSEQVPGDLGLKGLSAFLSRLRPAQGLAAEGWALMQDEDCDFLVQIGVGGF